MKREIRFRVWTGIRMELNIMAGYLGAFYVPGLDEKDSASMSPFNTGYSDSCPLMQFTGLLDCKGNDIFESDIVKCSDGRIAKVVWSESGWYIESKPFSKMEKSYSKMDKDEGYSMILMDARRYGHLSKTEIIGNAYANPELL